MKYNYDHTFFILLYTLWAHNDALSVRNIMCNISLDTLHIDKYVLKTHQIYLK